MKYQILKVYFHMLDIFMHSSQAPKRPAPGDAGHGEESVSTALSSHSLPNQMTESVSTLTSRPSRRASTTLVMDQRKRLVRIFLQTNDYLHPGSSLSHR